MTYDRESCFSLTWLRGERIDEKLNSMDLIDGDEVDFRTFNRHLDIGEKPLETLRADLLFEVRDTVPTFDVIVGRDELKA